MIITKSEYDKIMNEMPRSLSSDIKDGDPTHIDDHITIAQFLFGPSPLIGEQEIMTITRVEEDEWKLITHAPEGEDVDTLTHALAVEYWDDFIPWGYMDMYIGVESQKGLSELPPNDWPVGSSFNVLMGGIFATVYPIQSFLGNNTANLTAHSIWNILQLMGEIEHHQCYQQGVWNPPVPAESTGRQFWTGSNVISGGTPISSPDVGDRVWSIIPVSKYKERITNLETRITALEAKTP